MRLHPGDIFGRFQIAGILGEGGMGAVYRAVDTKLQRQVALKLLADRASAATNAPDAPDAPARPEAADRLLREARAAALIDHHNAVTVHDVGEIDGTPYIAMELVQGRTLRAYVGDASVPIATRARWLLQIARALEAAHARGIVHRDVKPENAIVRDDGTVKVLDFGLARMETGDGRSPAASWSPAEFEAWYATISQGEGGLSGTPRYMAPEQLRGVTSQHADQYGWGVTAYELLAGVPPWRGDAITYNELLARLDSDAPPLQAEAPGVPAEVVRVVERALQKDPSDRFPSMGDLVRALETATGGDTRPRRRAARAILALAGGAAIAATLGATAFRTARSSPSAPAFHPTNVRRITFGDSCEEYPSFTPDGTHVVFDRVRESDLVVVARDLTAGTEHDITSGGGWDMAPEVSPDGTEVAFLHAPPEGAPQARIVDFGGRRPPRTLCEGRIRPSFSPDGRSVWCGEGEHPQRVEIATGAVTRKLEMPPSASAALVREMKDGRVLVLVPTEQQTSAKGLALVERDGALRWLLQDRLEEALDLTPDDRFAFASRVTPAGNRELAAVPLSGGPPVAIAGADIAPSQGFRVAPHRRAAVWSTCHERTSLMRVDPREGGGGALVPLLREAHAWKESAASPVPGTRRLVVLSERDGTNAAWVVDRDEREPPSRLPLPGAPRSVSVSPDGRLAVFAMADNGIVLASIDGGTTRTLTSDPGDAKARFTHDGRTVVFSRAIQGGVRRVFAVDLAGGDPRPLLEAGSTEPAPSPVDDRMAYLAGVEETRRVPMIFDPKTGRSTRLSPRLGEVEGPYESLAFSGDGRRVGLLKGAGNTILEVDAATGETVRTIQAGTSSLLRLSYDGDEPIVGREQWIGNVWMADGRFD